VKHLTITYDDHTLFDGDVASLTWTDTADVGVEIKAALPRERPNLLRQLAEHRNGQRAE
jgi:hypothetical protein